MVPETAVFQRISDLSKTRWQPPRQEKLQYINTKSHFKKPLFLAKNGTFRKNNLQKPHLTALYGACKNAGKILPL